MYKRFSRAQALILYMIAAVGLIVMTGVRVVVDIDDTWFTVLYYLLFIVLPIVWATLKSGAPEALRPYPLQSKSTPTLLLLPFVMLMVCNGVTAVWQLPFTLVGARVRSNIPVAGNVRELLRNVLLVGALPAVCEEFLFRGVILSALEPYGTKRAVLVSSLMFTLMHGYLLGMPAIFLLGVVMSVIVICTGSIYSSIIFHTIYNTTGVLIMYFRQDAAEMLEMGAAPLNEALSLVIVAISASMYAVPAFFLLRAMVRRARTLDRPFFPERRERLTRCLPMMIISACVLLLLLVADILSMIPGVIE